MNSDTLKRNLKVFAKENGFELGFLKFSSEFKDLYEILENRKKVGYMTEFEEEDIETRKIKMKRVIEKPRSIIVGVFPYYSEKLDFYSNISVYTQVLDYHDVVRSELAKVAEEIKKEYLNLDYKILVDSSPFVERYLAQQAGLGFWGLNNNLISETYGSYFFIGTIIANLDFEEDQNSNKDCFGCGKCIEMCPGNALDEKFNINAQKCLSYLTQKKDTTMEDNEKIRVNGKVFGCDICQSVCPHNESLGDTKIDAFKENILKSLSGGELDLSNREFKRKYSNRAFSWRGKKIIARNLQILD